MTGEPSGKRENRSQGQSEPKEKPCSERKRSNPPGPEAKGLKRHKPEMGQKTYPKDTTLLHYVDTTSTPLEQQKPPRGSTHTAPHNPHKALESRIYPAQGDLGDSTRTQHTAPHSSHHTTHTTHSTHLTTHHSTAHPSHQTTRARHTGSVDGNKRWS